MVDQIKLLTGEDPKEAMNYLKDVMATLDFSNAPPSQHWRELYNILQKIRGGINFQFYLLFVSVSIH